MPAGASIEYWWLISTTGGNKLQTDKVILPINDERYDWQRLDGDDVILFWYRGDGDFGQELLGAAHEALKSLEEYKTLYIGVTFLAKITGGILGQGEHDCKYYSRDELKGMNIFPNYLMDELWEVLEASKVHDPARLDKGRNWAGN